MQTRRLTTKTPPKKPLNQTKELNKKPQTETPETKLTGFGYYKGLPYLGTQNLKELTAIRFSCETEKCIN